MTSKLSWIAFVPFTLAAIAIKVVQLFFIGSDGTFMGFNSLMLSYLTIACALAVLLFAVIFCLIDKKTASVYPINKNIAAGIVGLFLAVALACDGANRAFIAVRTFSADFFEIADIVLTIACAIVFVVLGLNHFVGNGGVRGLAVFYLIPALFSAFRLVVCFLGYTTVSITVTDVSVLVCYIFTTLFLFNYAMIVALMQGKSPVRSAFIYGMPAALMLLSYGGYALGAAVLSQGIVGFSLFSNLESIELLLLGIYILSFVIEMSICVRRKDEIELVTGEADEEYEDVTDPDAEMVNAAFNSVLHDKSPDAIAAVNSGQAQEERLSVDDEVYFEVAQASLDSGSDDYISDVDTADFIYGAPPTDDDFVLPVDSEEGQTEYGEDTEESAELYITKEDSTYDTEEEISEDDIDARIDRIDKLILEISEDEFK